MGTVISLVESDAAAWPCSASATSSTAASAKPSSSASARASV